MLHLQGACFCLVFQTLGIAVLLPRYSMIAGLPLNTMCVVRCIAVLLLLPERLQHGKQWSRLGFQLKGRIHVW
jgi:hypothetical protein